MSDSEIWKQLDLLFEKNELKEWAPIFDEIFRGKVNFDDLARSSKTLFELHSMNRGDSGKKKAIGYGLLNAECYIQSKRMAPAISVLDSLKKLVVSQDYINYLEQRIAQKFSNKQEVSQESSNTQRNTSTELIDSLHEEFKSEDSLDSSYEEFDLFQELAYKDVFELVKKAELIELKESESLFHEGEAPDGFYVVAEGKLQLKTSAGQFKEFKEGDFFGEIGVLSNQARNGSVSALSNSRLIRFSKEELIESFVAFPQLEEKVLKMFYLRLFLSMVSRSKAFKSYTEEQLTDFFYCFRPGRSKAGSILFKEGDPSKQFYFLLQGRVQIERKGMNSIELVPSNFIGEIGFLKDEPRTATARTIDDCHYLVLERYMFDNLAQNFPQIHEIMKKLAEYRQLQNLKAVS